MAVGSVIPRQEHEAVVIQDEEDDLTGSIAGLLFQLGNLGLHVSPQNPVACMLVKVVYATNTSVMTTTSRITQIRARFVMILFFLFRFSSFAMDEYASMSS